MKNTTRANRRIMVLLLMIALVSVSLMILVEAIKDLSARNNSEEGQDLVTNLDSIRGEKGPFDPNTVDSTTLLRYGLRGAQIHSLMSYRRHGGSFEVPLAISKLYNWSDDDVDKVLPYIVIDEKYKKTNRYREMYEAQKRAEYENMRHSYGRGGYNNGSNKYEGSSRYEHTSRNGELNERDAEQKYERKYDRSDKFTSLTKVDINTADTTLMRRIPGVGHSIANAIVKLRSKLGGFYSVEQLKDIEYISPELYEWFEVKDVHALHIININKASFQELNTHPYISYDQVRDLMAYRRLYGKIKDVKALEDTGIFNEKEIERLAPYLEY